MDNYAINLKDQKRWRLLFPYLYSHREYKEIVSLYKELLEAGTIKHTIDDFDTLTHNPECEEEYIEYKIVMYSTLAYYTDKERSNYK